MVLFKSVILIAVTVLAVFFSGCTGGQDVTPIIKAIPEVQQFLKEHPDAKITVTYWSKEDIAKLEQEISKQCDKPITPVAMYKATISEGDIKSIAWINAETQTVMCSATEGKGGSSANTSIPTTTSEPFPDRAPPGRGDVKLTVDSSARSTAVNIPAIYIINLTNTGNVTDAFNLAIQNPQNAAVTLNMILGQTSFTMSPGTYATGQLAVASATAGSFVVSVTATSQANPDKKSTITTTTTVGSSTITPTPTPAPTPLSYIKTIMVGET